MSCENNGRGLSRRRFLTVAGATGATLMTGRNLFADTTPAGEEFKGQTLRVFTYAGAWEKAFRSAFVPSFEKLTGAKVVVDPGWWDSIPKLKASPPGSPCFDLVLTDATQGYPAIREGMFQKVDMASIPNSKKVVASALDNWVFKDGYGIPFPESVMTLAWSKETVPTAPTGWGDCLKDEHKGKLGLYNSFYMSLFTWAAMKVGAEGKAGTAHALIEKDLEGVLKFAKENRDRVKYWWPTSTDMALNLSKKTCNIGNMHSPDILLAMKNDPKLSALVPKDDRAFVLLMWVVPAGTKVKSLAEKAIDHLFSEDMQEAFARNGSTTAIASVAGKVAASDPSWKQIYPSTEAELAAVKYYPYDAYFRQWDHIVEVWDKEVLRKS